MEEGECIAVYEEDMVVCYEQHRGGKRMIFPNERVGRFKCGNCESFADAVNKMIDERQKLDKRWS